MNGRQSRKRRCSHLLAGAGLLLCSFAAGCTVDVGGQTLPSPYYMTDDIQYYAPGPEFKLEREAAAMKANRAARLAGQQ